MDLLGWGANWLDQQSKLHASIDVIVVWGNVNVPLKASIVDEAGRVLPGVQNVKTEFTRFLFHTSDLSLNNIKLKPGLIIKKGNDRYELVTNGSRCWNYNDAYKKTIVVETKVCTVQS